MKIYEIIAGAILLAVAVAIIVLTLCQHTRGQGLSGPIGGDTSSASRMANARLSDNDHKLARLTMVAGIVLFVIALVTCTLSSRLG